ncbi:MAG: diacylglycerol kinase [Granulosicoccus sp.]
MNKNTGIKRVLKAGVYSYQGLCAALKHEAAFRQEAFLAAVMVFFALWLDVSRTERVILIAVTVLVLIVELLNSSLEAVVDRIGTEHHELSGRAKDIGSAAVLVSLILWCYVWLELVVLGLWLSSP